MRVGIVGGGESGVGAALLAKKKGYEVWLSDGGLLKEQNRKEIIANHIPFEERGHTLEILAKSEIVVKSPGVPADAPVVIELAKSGTELISEIEFGFRHCNGKIIAVTGSNGKTTTTHLVYEMTKGLGAVIGGNMGESFARVLAEKPDAPWYVLELSSFQLDDIVEFRPDIGLILNITPDHLDRYGNFEDYADSKMRIAMNMTREDLLIYNGGDPAIRSRLQTLPGCAKIGIDLVRIGDAKVPIGKKFRFAWGDMKLKGIHNRLNASFAIAAATGAGAKPNEIADVLKNFKSLPHRLEYVTTVDGVEFYNDSKATNVESVFCALESFDQPIIWIAGGLDKGNDYGSLVPLAEDKVKSLVCLGRDNSKLIAKFRGVIDRIRETDKIEEAVKMAWAHAEDGDVILLSPACASFDLFGNYEERGNLFKEYVMKL